MPQPQPLTRTRPCSLPPQQMTYVKQLENYEAAVMQKRLEEMTDTELEQMLTDVDATKESKAGKKE